MRRLIAAAVFLVVPLTGWAQFQALQVFPAAPASNEQFVIELRGVTPSSPAFVQGGAVRIEPQIVHLDLDIREQGFSVPGSYRYTTVINGLPAGLYHVILNRPSRPSVEVGQFTVGAPVAVAAPAHRNLSGLWFSADEAGWGVTIVQGVSEQLFAFWFTYGPSTFGSSVPASWFHMSNGQWVSPTEFRGVLYETTGPSAARDFDPAAMRIAGMGTLTLRFLNDQEVEFSAKGGSLEISPFEKRKTLRRFWF